MSEIIWKKYNYNKNHDDYYCYHDVIILQICHINNQIHDLSVQSMDFNFISEFAYELRLLPIDECKARIENMIIKSDLYKVFL